MSAHTPGPWHWKISLKSKTVELEGRGRTVTDFARWGMSGAAPRFAVDGLMVDAKDLTATVPGREHHEQWYRTLSHPDADLIAASPDLLTFAGPALELLEELLEELMAERQGGATTDAQRSALAELQRRIDLGRAAIAKARGGR